MTNNRYKTSRAICPMYKEESRPVIYCRGIRRQSRIHVAFKNVTDAYEFKEDFCRGNYQGCPVYQMLLEEEGEE